MNKFSKTIFVIFSLALLSYVSIPSPNFPDPPTDALQSDEPADTETPLRRAYFTNLTRQEVINHYNLEFNKGFKLPTIRLNYPPEEAQTIIRDQTRSTYLEELVHPFREGVYVNGFEPKNENDTIDIGGRIWRQKIIVRHVPSFLIVRVGVSTLILIAIYLLFKAYSYDEKN